MRTFLLSLLVIGGLIVGALLIAPSFVPQEWYREPIITALEEETGRDVEIEGDIGLSFFPQFNFHMEGVRISNAEGAKHPTMASMKTLDVGVNVFRLLQQELIVSRFVLEEPVIHFEIDKNGKSNFEFDQPDADTTDGPGPSPEETDQGPGDGAGNDLQVGTISLGDVRLVNGLVTYTNHQTGDAYEASDINASVSLPSYDGPFSADGSLTWLNENVAARVDVGNLKDLIEGGETSLATRIDSALVTQSFDGQSLGDRLQSVAGRASLDIPSLRKLAAWLGAPLPDGDGFENVSVTGDLTARNQRLLFKNADVTFDEIRATGGLTVILDGAVPYVSGRMDAETLNLNPYLGMENAPAESAGGGASESSGDGASGGGPSTPTGQGWSDDPIDLQGLKGLNANLKLTAQRVQLGGIKLNDSDLDLKINDGLLTANMANIALYKGTGTAKLVADGRNRTPKISQTFSLDTIDLLPLMRDAGGVDRLEGTGNVVLDVTMRGRSQRQMMQSLNGTGNVEFLNGAIRGVNLADLVRNLRDVLGGLQNTGVQKTDFAELSGNFVIRNGVLSNNDLVLLNPLLRLSGAGTINIANRTINYRFVPKAVSTIEGQGGQRDVTGISVPVIVTGSWDNPTFAPDVGSIIEGVLGGAGGGSQNEGEPPADPLETILEGLFGGPPEGESSPPESQNNDDAEQGNQQEQAPPDDPLGDLFKILQNQ